MTIDVVEPLTEREAAVLGYFLATIEAEGRRPGYAEAAARVGYQGKGSILNALHRIEKKGYIKLVRSGKVRKSSHESFRIVRDTAGNRIRGFKTLLSEEP